MWFLFCEVTSWSWSRVEVVAGVCDEGGLTSTCSRSQSDESVYKGGGGAWLLFVTLPGSLLETETPFIDWLTGIDTFSWCLEEFLIDQWVKPTRIVFSFPHCGSKNPNCCFNPGSTCNSEVFFFLFFFPVWPSLTVNAMTTASKISLFLYSNLCSSHDRVLLLRHIQPQVAPQTSKTARLVLHCLLFVWVTEKKILITV